MTEVREDYGLLLFNELCTIEDQARDKRNELNAYLANECNNTRRYKDLLIEQVKSVFANFNVRWLYSISFEDIGSISIRVPLLESTWCINIDSTSWMGYLKFNKDVLDTFHAIDKKWKECLNTDYEKRERE